MSQQLKYISSSNTQAIHPYLSKRARCTRHNAASFHGPYVRWTMDILSFEWRVNFTRVAVFVAQMTFKVYSL